MYPTRPDQARRDRYGGQKTSCTYQNHENQGACQPDELTRMSMKLVSTHCQQFVAKQSFKVICISRHKLTKFNKLAPEVRYAALYEPPCQHKTPDAFSHEPEKHTHVKVVKKQRHRTRTYGVSGEYGHVERRVVRVVQVQRRDSGYSRDNTNISH